MKPCKMVLFDLDGTVLDTLEDIAQSVNQALRLYGFPERTREEVRSFLGNGSRYLIEKAVPENASPEEIELVHQCHNAYYAAHCCVKTAPFDGIPRLLKTLREHGILTAVVSNKPDNATQETCRHYFDGCLDAAIGQQDGIARKPQPDMAMLVLSRFGIAPEEAVYVGDTEVDYQTALNGGMRPILVSWGFRDREALAALNAEIITDTMEQLEKRLLG